jgi:membrane protein YdbS with pleckstrin-like domain
LGSDFGEFSPRMALINCPDCGKEVSTAAKACPSCGFPVAEKVAPSGAPSAKGPTQGELLAEVRPSWWNYFWHLFFFFLIVPPIIAWYRRASLVLRVFPNRITIERGVFSKCYQDYLPRDIRSIDVDQSFLARMVGIGNITISTAATAEASEKIQGIPDPKAIRELILKQRGNL